MEVGSSATVKSVATEAEVKVLTKQKAQQEAVVGTILEGVESSTPRNPAQSGQKLNIEA